MTASPGRPLRAAVIASALARSDAERDRMIERVTVQGMPPEVALYRARNPRSRAVAHTHWARSSGHVRRATCIYCRAVVATSCAGYRETKRAARARVEHGARCAEAYVAGVLAESEAPCTTA